MNSASIHSITARMPNLVIAPPLSGCSTMASLVRGQGVIVDCDQLPGFSVHGLSLHERKEALLRLAETVTFCHTLCLPVLPSATLTSHVVGVVLISAATFAKRLVAIPDSKYADGHRAAAVMWRDEAVRLAAQYDIPVFTKLSSVPNLSSLRVGE
jgi:hypothetical protein